MRSSPNRSPHGEERGNAARREGWASRAPTGQKSAPATGLALGWIERFGEFVAAVLVDTGIVRRADDGDDGRNGGRAGFSEIVAGAEQRRGRGVQSFWRRRCRRRRGGGLGSRG